MKKLQPITRDRRQVALMIRVAVFFHPAFGREDHWNEKHIREMAAGRRKPSAAMLERLNLIPTEGGYQWHLS